ncbi:hypothetical protein [Enterococcus faecalis]|uniref:DUF4179 domain-containing protein n=1 Tax=Enterococcus faecalis RP2S-4 TaxID=1244145 RepID=A0ABC9TQ44_ENTFL|nr:hypothetical protein [Enterococcus faecalis]EPI11336.1 hypothetical protein D358_00343 [Enterococcus faecalis RP2S-4]
MDDNDRIKKILEEEQEIPKEILEKLTQSRKNLLTKTKIKKKHFNKKSMAMLLIAAIAGGLMIIIQVPVSSAIEKVFGISRDQAVKKVEELESETVNLNLSSTQNDLEIKLTKFVSTKKKFAFDYQFKLRDDKLRTLLGKNTKGNIDKQMIDIGLTAEGSFENIYGGVGMLSTYRVENDTFYGSVISTFDETKVPKDKKLTLHVYSLEWIDMDEYDSAKNDAAGVTNGSFSVTPALKYEGDWSYPINYKPLLGTKIPKISSKENIENVMAVSDALQTTVRFKAPLKDLVNPYVAIYKDGFEMSPTLITRETYNPEDETYELTFSLSTLDKGNTVYTLQLNESDFFGNVLKEIGSFKIQNK